MFSSSVKGKAVMIGRAKGVGGFCFGGVRFIGGVVGFVGRVVVRG